MSPVVAAVLAALAGACIALQASANGKFRENLQSPAWAAYFSIGGTVLTATLAMLLLRPALPSRETLSGTPWWNWIGGPLGLLIVLAGATLVRDLGGAMFIALVVGGQLLCSLLLDHYGLMGLIQKEITLGRVVGAVLVVVGVVCIKWG